MMTSDETYKSEVSRLKVTLKHIDFSRKILKNVQVKTRRMHDVDIPLGDWTMKILECWKRCSNNDRFVFIFMARNVGLHIMVTMHLARHSFAVMSINNGKSVYMPGRFLGHSSTVTTEKTYAAVAHSSRDLAYMSSLRTILMCKWIERQNRSISKQFTEIVRKIESLYRNDAARQVEAARIMFWRITVNFIS